MREIKKTKKQMTEDLIMRLRDQLIDELDYTLELQIQLIDNSIMPVQRNSEYRFIKQNKQEDKICLQEETP